MSRIFLQQAEGSLVDMVEQPYESEGLLQELLAKYPSLLAGDQMTASSPRRWILIDREYRVPDNEGAGGRWSLDHLYVDQDGVPTMVEVKRSTDSRIRREVIGQMLDYAANAVVYWPIEGIRQRFELGCERAGKASDEVLRELLEEEEGLGEFWQVVATNLKAGRVRLVFVADKIPTELQRVVEFLNEQMTPAEVLAVEVKQFASEDGAIRTLVPRVVGQTAAAMQAKRPGGVSPSDRLWPAEDLRRALAELENQLARRRLTELLDWTLERGLFIATQRATPGFGISGPLGTRILTFAAGTDDAPSWSWCYLGKDKFPDTSIRDQLVGVLQALGMVDPQLGVDEVASRGIRRNVWDLTEDEFSKLVPAIEAATQGHP